VAGRTNGGEWFSAVTQNNVAPYSIVREEIGKSGSYKITWRNLITGL
jgi:hypothetical protein